jgi:hypothetical protein
MARHKCRIIPSAFDCVKDLPSIATFRGVLLDASAGDVDILVIESMCTFIKQ